MQGAQGSRSVCTSGAEPPDTSSRPSTLVLPPGDGRLAPGAGDVCGEHALMSYTVCSEVSGVSFRGAHSNWGHQGALAPAWTGCPESAAEASLARCLVLERFSPPSHNAPRGTSCTHRRHTRGTSSLPT